MTKTAGIPRKPLPDGASVKGLPFFGTGAVAKIQFDLREMLFITNAARLDVVVRRVDQGREALSGRTNISVALGEEKGPARVASQGNPSPASASPESASVNWVPVTKPSPPTLNLSEATTPQVEAGRTADQSSTLEPAVAAVAPPTQPGPPARRTFIIIAIPIVLITLVLVVIWRAQRRSARKRGTP